MCDDLPLNSLSRVYILSTESPETYLTSSFVPSTDIGPVYLLWSLVSLVSNDLPAIVLKGAEKCELKMQRNK